jgi:hypothetical protein
MGKVVAQAIMPLDGYVAKQDNTIDRLFDCLQNGEVEIPTLIFGSSSPGRQRFSSGGQSCLEGAPGGPASF